MVRLFRVFLMKHSLGIERLGKILSIDTIAFHKLSLVPHRDLNRNLASAYNMKCEWLHTAEVLGLRSRWGPRHCSRDRMLFVSILLS